MYTKKIPDRSCGTHGVIVTTCLVATLTACTSTPSSPIPASGAPPAVLDASGRLAQAQQRWAAQKVSSYDFSIRIRCFCVFPQAVSFHVRDGTSSAVGLDAATRARLAQFESIDALFLLLHQYLEENPGRFEVEYEPSMGYPTRADLDLILGAADDELRFDVTDFGLLR